MIPSHLPNAKQQQHTRNPSCDNPFKHLQAGHKSTQLFPHDIGNKRGSPQDCPQPPDCGPSPIWSNTKRLTSSHTLNNAKYNCIDSNKAGEPCKRERIQIKNVHHCYKQIGKTKQKPCSSRIIISLYQINKIDKQ